MSEFDMLDDIEKPGRELAQWHKDRQAEGLVWSDCEHCQGDGCEHCEGIGGWWMERQRQAR